MNLDLSWSKFQPCLHQTALSASILDFKWVYECCKTLFHSQLMLSVKIMPLKSPPPPTKTEIQNGCKILFVKFQQSMTNKPPWLQKGCIREIIIDKCTQQGPTRYEPSDKRLSKIKYCVSEASNVRQTAHGFYTYLVVSTGDRGGYVDEKHFFKVEMGRGYVNTSPVFIFSWSIGSCVKVYNSFDHLPYRCRILVVICL